MAVFTIIKDSFVQFYEHLFKLVVVNIIWFILTVLVFMFGYAGIANNWILPVIIPLILGGPFFLSGLSYINRLFLRDQPKIKDYFTGIKKYFKRGLLACLFSSVIYFILVLDLLFFIRQSANNTMWLILGVLFLYLVLLFSMVQLFFWALLIIQEKEKIRVVIKRAFLLTLDNAVFAFIWLILTVIIAAILFVTGVGLPVVFMGLIGLFLINGTQHILQKYET